MKPKHQDQRIAFVVVGLIALAGAFGLTFWGLKENISYFYSPIEILESRPEAGKKIRLGGMVEEGSFVRVSGLEVKFIVTDFKHTIPVTYKKILPDLFREGQGVIAEGMLGDDGVFVASRVLAKHDENYMPPEVAEALGG